MRKRRRRKLKRKTPFIITCLLLLGLLAGGGMLVKDMFFPGGNGALSSDSPEEVGLDKRLNVLLLGIDARRGETMARTDTMILASVDPQSKQMCLLSIPRDTGVNIPGHGWDKINSAAVYGGPELSLKAVSNLLGTSVRYYVVTNFSGFKDVVDTLGGVTLDVEQNMYHWDPEDGGAYEINLKQGLQRLDGDKALQYVRYRNYDMGDIDRTKNQQKFLAALAEEILQPGTIPKLPKLVPVINRYVDTNLGLSDLYTLATAARNLADGNIVTQTLPGRPVIVNGLSYWGVNPVEARQVLAKLFKGETVARVVMTTPIDSRYLPENAIIGPVETDEEKESEPEQEQDEDGLTPGEPSLTAGRNVSEGEKDGSRSSSTSRTSGTTVIITPVDDSDSGTSTGPGSTSENNYDQAGSDADGLNTEAEPSTDNDELPAPDDGTGTDIGAADTVDTIIDSQNT